MPTTSATASSIWYFDGTVFRAADEDALLDVVVDDVERVVGRDEHAARRAELRSLIDEGAVWSKI